MSQILVIDDDELFSAMLVDLVKNLGHQVSSAHTLRGGMEKLQEREIDLVLLDVQLPDGNGLSKLAQIRSAPSTPEVIILTAFGDNDGAEKAIQSGAWDYLEKTSSISMVTLPVMRAIQYRDARKQLKPPPVLKREGILGRSLQIESCLGLVARAAAGDASVLIVGETGTGKELFARAIHENSERSGMNFVAVDCAALPPTLVESVLFGHEKGTFTGADRVREGLILQAHGGTLFLDEVGELPLDIQKTFLRVLHEHRFRPIGGRRELESDFRLVAATNRDLEQMVREGRFREDLFFRLRTFMLNLPPLRKHRGDIAELAMNQIAKLAKRYGTSIKGLSPEFLETLGQYEWPGNVRELLSAVERAFAEAQDEPILFPYHLPADMRVKVRLSSARKKEGAANGMPVTSGPAATFPKLQDVRTDALNRAEKGYVVELLQLTGGDMRKAVRASGLSRSQIYRLMQKHGVKRPAGPGRE